jgi:hypothetical protein
MTESEQNTYCRLCALVLNVFSQRGKQLKWL